MTGVPVSLFGHDRTPNEKGTTMAMFKQNDEELQSALKAALAEQQNEELALVKAQLAVANDKNAQLERQVTRLKVELKSAETAAAVVKALQAVLQPIVDESVKWKAAEVAVVAANGNGHHSKPEAVRP